jgi:hypothetical protein
VVDESQYGGGHTDNMSTVMLRTRKKLGYMAVMNFTGEPNAIAAASADADAHLMWSDRGADGRLTHEAKSEWARKKLTLHLGNTLSVMLARYGVHAALGLLGVTVFGGDVSRFVRRFFAKYPGWVLGALVLDNLVETQSPIAGVLLSPAILASGNVLAKKPVFQAGNDVLLFQVGEAMTNAAVATEQLAFQSDPDKRSAAAKKLWRQMPLVIGTATGIGLPSVQSIASDIKLGATSTEESSVADAWKQEEKGHKERLDRYRAIARQYGGGARGVGVALRTYWNTRDVQLAEAAYRRASKAWGKSHPKAKSIPPPPTVKE